jgi:RimJ/RimL family protein N-acetyltransferase
MREAGPDAVYVIDVAGAADEPTSEPQEKMPYDEWRARFWDFPTFTLDGSFVALADGTPASIAMLFVDTALGRATNAFTATLPAYRGRGLALAAKIASLRWAAANGIEQVATGNDDTNAPMLAINRRLGYRPIGRLVTYKRQL